MPSPQSSNKPKPKLAGQPKAPLQPQAQWSFEGIGTQWWIGLYQSVGPGTLKSLQTEIAALVETFDATYSRFRSDSLVTTWSQAAGKYELPADMLPLLDMYKRLYDATDGAVTPLIGQVMSDAGYDANYSLQPKPDLLTRPPRWEDTLRYDTSTIEILRPALLDFGAAGKGYLVDLLCELLETNGVRHYCVDGSGDMRYRSGKAGEPLAVGLEHPDDPSQVIGVARLIGGALCGSAGNRRAWGEYTHIIDPFTQASPQHLKAVWVTAATTMLADGLATALYFAAPEKLQKHFRFEYTLINADMTRLTSDTFPAEFF